MLALPLLEPVVLAGWECEWSPPRLARHCMMSLEVSVFPAPLSPVICAAGHFQVLESMLHTKMQASIAMQCFAQLLHATHA